MQIESCCEEGITELVSRPVQLSTNSQNDPTSQQRPMIPYHNCTGCCLPILDSSFLLLDNNYWHFPCLRCSICNVPLGGDMTCFVKDNRNYCRQDYQRFFSPRRCQRCGTHIEPYELVMKVQGAVYHANPFCFSCTSCQRPLVAGEKYMLDERGLGCIACAHKTNQSRKRKQNVTSAHIDSMEGMTAKSYVTHDSGSSTIERHQKIGNYRQTQKIKRMRTSFKHHQLRAMKSYFTVNHNPDAKDLKQLAQETGLTKRVLQVWFQNARAKYRRTSDQHTKCSRGIEMQSISEIKTEMISRENDDSGLLDSNSDSFTFSVDNSPDEIENCAYESSSHSEDIIDSVPSEKQHKYQSFFGCLGKQGTADIADYLHNGYDECMAPTSSANSSALQSL